MAKKKTINIFYVIADSSLTGAPRHLLSLVDNLPKKDFAVSVVLPQGPLADELKRRKVHTFLVPMRARSDTAAVNRLQKLLKKYDPDIVHAHGSRAGLIARWAVRGMPIKVVYTEHTRTAQFRLANPVLDWAHIRAMKALDQVTDMNIAVSKAVANFLVAAKVTKPHKIKVIYNGIELAPRKHIDNATLDIITRHGLRSRDVIIGTIGSLNIQKDTATLLRAMQRVLKKLPKSRLVIVGSGPLKQRLEQLARKLKISDQAIFTGAVNDISSILQVMTVFVLPSRSEAFGISILEAMGASVPVIATRVGGIPEVITNNQNGLLIEPGDPKLLASTIIRLLNDRKLQQKLIRGGHEAIRKFSTKEMVQKTADLYQELIKKQ
ncbi:hypothetical protein A2V68_02890 [candidate division Kazan bacterium RBG_13_50_9]|uniref:Glycosyl transferase family 1 n=1 Tax=candidate division Kazan bacterium RBG_13_50_9 TaxID=1798535 RepID=A0A1F4NSV1_UNCK3|nr:MAG: hypothetical protein A2V68_02890 [candidate division Kazan bacterium RBG_13_50_9]